MQIITTHTRTDFDALASMVAGTFLYPKSFGILPSQINPNVNAFLTLHQDLFHILPRKGFDFQGVSKLVVVDANSWKRLDRMQELQKQDPGALETHVWDHHMNGGDIVAAWESRQELGANVTQMLEEMKLRDCAFAPMHATLFLMGIYEDTGNLTYPSTTYRDAAMAAFLLKNGADLNVAGAYLAASFDADQTEILSHLLAHDKEVDVGGYKVAICMVEKSCGPLMLAPVVGKYAEIKKVDAVFGVFRLDNDTCAIIARSAQPSLNVGQIVRALGGGGHPGAGSAMVKGEDVHNLYARVMEMAAGMPAIQPRVEQIMSLVEWSLEPDMTMAQAIEVFDKRLARAAMVIRDEKCVGLISELELSRAKTPGQLSAPIKSFMNRNFPVAQPNQSLQQSLQCLSKTGLPLLPVESEDRVVGQVTRTDLMLQLYEFQENNVGAK